MLWNVILHVCYYKTADLQYRHFQQFILVKSKAVNIVKRSSTYSTVWPVPITMYLSYILASESYERCCAKHNDQSRNIILWILRHRLNLILVSPISRFCWLVFRNITILSSASTFSDTTNCYWEVGNNHIGFWNQYWATFLQYWKKVDSFEKKFKFQYINLSKMKKIIWTANENYDNK